MWPTAYAESGGIGTQSTEQGSQIAPKQTDEIAAKGFKLTAREERELSARLDGAGMLRLVPESDARELANILTVRKSWDAAKKVWRLRLLFDRRRRNSVERQLPTDAMLALAQGPDLCEIILLPTEELRFDSSDLDNWYYQFDVSADRATTNVYGKPRPLSDFQGFRAAAGLQTHGETAQQIRYCAALGSMAMGDHNACEFGQSVHLAVLRASGCARESELLRLREPVPRGDLVEGIVIDDHGLVYKIPWGRRCTDGPGGRRAAEIRVAASRGYADAGIHVKATKTVVGASTGVLWGAEIRGREGRVGAQRARRGDLAALTVELALLGAGTRDLVRRIVGSWVSVFLYRRPLLAIFDACFAWSGDRSVDPHRIDKLPSEVQTELLEAALMSPFAETDLRARFAAAFTASDASPYGAGAVTAEIPEEVAQEMWRYRDRRGAYVRLDDPDAAEGIECDAAVCGEHEREAPWRRPSSKKEWCSELVRGLQFRTSLQYTFRRRGAHINVCEHRGRRSWLRKLVRDPQNHGTRQLLGLDSQVTVGSAAKGRSSAKAINHECRKTMPLLIAAEIQEGIFWVRSASNPADGPSPGADPPRAEARLPWVAKFLNGDRAALGERLQCFE